MAESYLYACLVEAVEDEAKSGVVLYDPRVDWKLKANMVLLVAGKPMRMSAYFGDQGERPNLEARREGVEQVRKKNTSKSAHRKNTALEKMSVFEIARADGEAQMVNGVRLFTLPVINRLLEQVFDEAGVQGWTFPLPR